MVAENIILRRRAKYLYRGDREIEKMYGYESIPKEWRDTLIDCEGIESLCRTAAENWG